MTAVKKPADYITPEDYLAHYANDLEEKWELIDGKVYALAGASREHNTIALNLATLLKSHLRGSPCKPFMSDMRVTVQSNFYYPDVLVDCGQGEDKYVASEPTLIIEVLSKSTSLKDRSTKLWDYQKIDSLQEYALVEQDTMQVTVYRRSQDWLAKTYKTGDVVTLESLGVSVPIEVIYEDIEFRMRII